MSAGATQARMSVVGPPRRERRPSNTDANRGCKMSKGSLVDLKAESEAHDLVLLSSDRPPLVDEFAVSISKSDRPVEDRSIERLMAVAKELARGDRQQAGLPAEDRQPREEGYENVDDRLVEIPPVMSPR